MASPAKRASWSGEDRETFPLVLPQALFSASEGEESDDLHTSFTGSGIGVGGVSRVRPSFLYIAILHVIVCISSFSPWWFNQYNFVLQCSAFGIFFCGFACATAVWHVLLSRSGKIASKNKNLVVLFLMVKTFLGFFFLATPEQDDVQWSQTALPILGVCGLFDGSLVALVAHSMLAPLSSHEAMHNTAGGQSSIRFSSLVALLRGDASNLDWLTRSFTVRHAEIIGACVGGLCSYVSGAIFGQSSLGVKFSIFRISGDTFPMLLLTCATFVTLIVYICAPKPSASSMSLSASSSRRAGGQKNQMPELRVSVFLLKLVENVVPIVSSLSFVVCVMASTWLLEARGVLIVSELWVFFAWMSILLWFYFLHFVIDITNEHVKLAALLIGLAVEIVACAVALVMSPTVTATSLVVCVSGLHGMHQEFSKRKEHMAFLRSLGASLGCGIVMLALALSSSSVNLKLTQVVRWSASVALLCALLLALSAVAEIVTVARRRHIMEVVASRAASSRTDIVALLQIEAEREIGRLRLASLSLDDADTMAKFLPKPDDSEARLRECVSELRLLRKKYLALEG